MSNFVMNDTEDAIYFYMINRLIKQNKIKIIEKGERHFIDVIELA